MTTARLSGLVRYDGLRVTVATFPGGLVGFASPARVAEAFDRGLLPAGAILVQERGRVLYHITIEPEGRSGSSWYEVRL